MMALLSQQLTKIRGGICAIYDGGIIAESLYEIIQRKRLDLEHSSDPV